MPVIVFFIFLIIAGAAPASARETPSAEVKTLNDVRVLAIRKPYIHVSDGVDMYEIKKEKSTRVYSKSHPEGINLKEFDLVDIEYQRTSPTVLSAETVHLKKRPDPKEAKKMYKKTIRDFIFLSKDVPKGKIISRVVVDTNHQKVLVYDTGHNLIAISRCVTGKSGWYTPTGSFKIYTKEGGRYLDGKKFGEDYRLWVDHWMPFFKDAGLHDANWRWSFDVNHYIYGSHGCVNLPPPMAKFIYEHSKIGTPVTVI